jgi:hypothetical protein
MTEARWLSAMSFVGAASIAYGLLMLVRLLAFP